MSGKIKMPSLVVYKNGVRVDLLGGTMNKNDLENYLVKNGGYFDYSLFKIKQFNNLSLFLFKF